MQTPRSGALADEIASLMQYDTSGELASLYRMAKTRGW
jgi:hypothetical protein